MKNVDNLEHKKSLLANQMAPKLPNPEIFHDNDNTVVFPNPEADQAFVALTHSPKASLGRNTMQAFESLVSPENQGSLDRVDHNRPRILMPNDQQDRAHMKINFPGRIDTSIPGGLSD